MHESIQRCNFAKYLFLGYGLLENRICSYKILRKLFRKIWSVLTKFWTRCHGKFDLFLRYFLLIENRMCSCRILRKLSWKFWCVLVHFASPGKFICVLIKELCLLLENLRCSYYIQVSWEIWCVLEIFFKNSLTEKNRYFTKIARRLLLYTMCEVKHTWSLVALLFLK